MAAFGKAERLQRTLFPSPISTTTSNRGWLVNLHSGRGEPRSPLRQSGLTENRLRDPVFLALAKEGAAGQVQLAGGDGFVAAGDAECFAKLMFFGGRIPRHGG